MNQSTPSLTGLLSLLFLLVAVAASSAKQIPKFTVVEVNPSALDVMVHAFDQVLLLIHDDQDAARLELSLKQLQDQAKAIKEAYPHDHTLFAYLNKSTDFKGVLHKYGSENGLKLINTFETKEYHQANEDFIEFYSGNVHPKLPLRYLNDIRRQRGHQKFILAFSFTNHEDLNLFNQVYEKIRHFVGDFDTLCVAVPELVQPKGSISLYQGKDRVNTYSFFNKTAKEVADELIQSVNIDTLPTLITMNETTFSRVFGGSVSDQLLFIHSGGEQTSQEVESALEEFQMAANANRFEGLAYERVLFATVDKDFFQDNFNEEVSSLLGNGSPQYVIYFTKTDYDRFQLKRYRFHPQSHQWRPLSNQWQSQQLLQFIEDVRYKRLDPQYKSQEIPSEQEQSSRILRKIVGKTFISEVYEKPDQSILILFIDSKDETSYRHIQSLLEEFTLKHKTTLSDKLATGIFDLDKNQHKMLYLKEAPQLILFDKSNKKQTKYIKLGEELSLQSLEAEIAKAVTNIVLPLGHDDL